ncbi:Uncharacterized protein DBV15_01237 [Temnothorax longispinosus]|uniref:Uncharacterized protein n=1 Tax=Temnothorax longispinosus TaxID=300112 RepID=A0A4S2KNX6_9HYME|nr:Uncharacterized protein DBV15_01237 [Temnothorax longispinosus]
MAALFNRLSIFNLHADDEQLRAIRNFDGVAESGDELIIVTIRNMRGERNREDPRGSYGPWGVPVLSGDRIERRIIFEFSKAIKREHGGDKAEGRGLITDILSMASLALPGFQLVHRLAGDHDGKSPRRRGRLKTTPPASTGDQTLGTLTRWGFGVPRGGGATSRVGVPNRRGGVQPPRRLVGSRGERSPRRITETVQRVPPAPFSTRTSPSPRDHEMSKQAV